MAADFIAFRLDQIQFAGAMHDPVAALLLSPPPHVDLSVINGKVVVRDGHIQTIDLPVAIEQHNKISRDLINRAG
jgi:hypothetical protein